MKKRIIAFAAVLILLCGVYFFGSGFLKSPTVFVQDFSVSEDGTEMTLSIGVSGSKGFVRKISEYQQMGGKLYLNCYSAFGGLNGSVGAKTVYTVSLAEDTQSIALFRNVNCYEVVLQKDSTGQWQRV